MKKLILIMMSFLLFTTGTNASSKKIEFDEADFVTYFKKINYKVTSTTEIAPHLSDYDIVKTYSAINESNNAEIGLYKFTTKETAYNYFKFVYEENKDNLTEIELYNLNQEKDSNYSTLKAKLNEVRYFYIANIDNYIIKSNIEIDYEEDMDIIYDDLNLIENKKKFIFFLVFIILLILAIGAFASGFILKRKFLKNKSLDSK